MRQWLSKDLIANTHFLDWSVSVAFSVQSHSFRYYTNARGGGGVAKQLVNMNPSNKISPAYFNQNCCKSAGLFWNIISIKQYLLALRQRYSTLVIVPKS